MGKDYRGSRRVGTVPGRRVMLPRWENSQLVLPAANGPGNWIGAASAMIHGDHIYLAYRDRHPVEKGRGNRAYVARSPIHDGINSILCASSIKRIWMRS